MREFAYGIGIVLLLTLVAQAVIYCTDLPMWNEVEKHADGFVYDYTTIDKGLSTLILYDKDSTYVCEVLLDHQEKKCAIFGEHKLLAGSINHFKSKKLYKIFVKKIPEDDIEIAEDYKETVLEQLKRME